MVNFEMATTTETNQIGETVGRFPVAVKLAQFLNMMNIKCAVATRAIAANLASVIIALSCASALPTPVRSVCIWFNGASIPIRITFFASFNRHHGISAFSRTKPTATQTLLMCSCLIFLAAEFANKCDVYFRFVCAWFGLSGRKFRAALIRAKSRLAIGPFLEFLSTPVTDKNRTLRRVSGRTPTCVKSTFLGAIFPCFRFGGFERLAAVFASVCDSLRVPPAFATTKSGIAIGIFGIFKRLSAMLASKIVSHLDTLWLCLLWVMNWGTWPRVPCLSAGSYSAQALQDYMAKAGICKDTDARITPGRFPAGVLQ